MEENYVLMISASGSAAIFDLTRKFCRLGFRKWFFYKLAKNRHNKDNQRYANLARSAASDGRIFFYYFCYFL